MNRPHAVRTPAPCSRGRRKPACTALTTLLATAAALVATAQAAPAGATTQTGATTRTGTAAPAGAAARAGAAPRPGPSPVSAPPPADPAAAGAPSRPPDGAAAALAPAAAGGVLPVTMASAEVTGPTSRPPLAPGRPPVRHPAGGTQTRPRDPGAPPAAKGGPVPGTLAGLAPSAAATGVGGVLSPADSPVDSPASALPQQSPAAADEAPQTGTVPEEAASAVANVLKAALPDLPKSVRLRQEDAAAFLRASGIRWRSSGGCSDRDRPSCTSFDGLRWGTLKGLLDFRAESGCPVTVTGGTERGHAGGPRSHATGHKLDIAPSRCVDAAIARYPYQGVRGDGARLYRSPDGTLFARERDHWDITFA